MIQDKNTIENLGTIRYVSVPFVSVCDYDYYFLTSNTVS
jgi:hypothetical protein